MRNVPHKNRHWKSDKSRLSDNLWRDSLKNYNGDDPDPDWGKAFSEIKKAGNKVIESGRSTAEIAASLQEQYDKKTKKTKKIRTRRSSFNTKRKDLFIALIKSGAPYECCCCANKQDLAIDHIKPLSKGGSDDIENLQFLCMSCNSKKGNR